MTDSFFRGRRLRERAHVREFVRETYLAPRDFIYPIFVVEGQKKREPISSMEGIERLSVDQLGGEIDRVASSGITSVLLFGLPDGKNAEATGAWKDQNVVQKAIREVKRLTPKMTVITDVCLCAYTDHGHCGVVANEQILNDESLPIIAKMALSHAEAGADIVAPSDMMDGRVRAIRELLDSKGYWSVPVLSYAAKYASGFYGPFREAAHSGFTFGDRKSYQMDSANAHQAIRELEADLEEGADLLMVKPALAYLDIIRQAKDRFNVPIVAYNVSGEYSMVKAAASKGWIDEKTVVREMLTAMKRAGADKIISYFARDIASFC